MCNEPAISREHVPPLCLFPEEKDIPNFNFRKNLITVPSCEQHNGKKSKEDEYLMAGLAGVVGNNYLGLYHTCTKVKRGLEKSGVNYENLVLTNPRKMNVELNDGKEHEVFLGLVDNQRLENCFKHIAFGLYYHEFKKAFVGEHVIVIDFVNDFDPNYQNHKAAIKDVFDSQSANWKIKGANPEVFEYQFGEPDQHGIALKMTFYGGSNVYVAFKESQ